MSTQRRVVGLILFAHAASWTVACGGDEEPPPPPQVTSFAYGFSAADPCGSALPRPNDVFADDELVSTAAGCGLPADPIEAAIARVQASDGAPLDSKLTLPVEGVEIQAASLTASVAFTLSASTSAAGPLPPFVLLEQVGAATVAAGWRVVAHTAAMVDGKVQLTPAAPLAAARRHVVVATHEVRNARGNRLEAAPITRLLLGSTPIAAGAVEGLDAAGAAQLERERLRLAPLVGLLAKASPALVADDITAIQGFTTQLGYARMTRAVATYQAAVTRGAFTFGVTASGGDVTPEQIDPRWVMACPPGRTVVGCYDRVRAFRRGTVRVPKLLDAAGHLRTGWASTAVEYVEVPFLASIPLTVPMAGAPVTVLIPGYGRGRLDARELSNEFAGSLGAIVLAVELDRHGERTVDPTTGMPDLVDMRSNGIVEVAMDQPDGVPDRSGVGFFRGEPQALRDVQIAATIELLHVLETLKRRDAFVSQGIEPDGRQVNVIAQGQAAHIGLHLGAFAGNIRTMVLPSGGAGVKELIAGAPEPIKDGFLASAPAGVTRANLDAYLTRLEQTVLESVSVERSAQGAYDKLIRPTRTTPRVLVPHGERAVDVSTAARARLVAALTLPNNRVSQHHGRCDNFFLFTCGLGDSFEWVVGARNQLSTFASSNGVTVSAPAP